jgi:hypothetical protein
MTGCFAPSGRRRSRPAENLAQPPGIAEITGKAGRRIWGISTLVTTQLTPGVGVLLDSTKFGRWPSGSRCRSGWDSPTMI